MTDALSVFLADTRFRLATLSGLGWLDLALVTLLFFAVLIVIRRSRAAFLLRGSIAVGALLLVGTILLPLPTFDWLLRSAFLALLVAIPVALQPEIRRALERYGRRTGLTRSVQQTAAESVMPQVLRAVEQLAASQTGALIVLEGRDSLDEIIATGVPVDGRVTAELLQTIFFLKTPLHDGAVILRGDKVVAAGCVLPLTEQTLAGQRRLGTRHRAAVGLSEVSDALAIAVSEETGRVAVAQTGRLAQRLDAAALRQRLAHFFTDDQDAAPGRRRLWEALLAAWPDVRLRRPSRRELYVLVSSIGGAIVLTLAAWSFVIEQSNPTERPRFERVSLRVDGPAPPLTLARPLPETVSVVVRTTADIGPSLSANSFQAVVALADLDAGLHQVPVQVQTGARPVQIVSVEPRLVDVELVPTISRTLPVSVRILDPGNLSAAFEIVDTPEALPQTVEITGPAPLVERAATVEATLAIANASATIQETRPLLVLDENGAAIGGLQISPAQAHVTLRIARRQDARDVGVRAVIDGIPPVGYWLSGVRVEPASVTLRGEPVLLTSIGFVETAPLNVRQAMGEMDVTLPLVLPDAVVAVDAEGRRVQSVRVVAQIAPRTGDLLVSRRVQRFGPENADRYTATPAVVDVLLSGPLPLLQAVEAQPDLVQLFVDVGDLPAGERATFTPRVVVPEGLSYQLVPDTIDIAAPP